MKVWEKAEKYLSGRRAVVLAAGLLLASLLPLLWLGKYNVMCIDDYDYGRRVHDVWQETGSFAASAQEAWRQNMDFYQEWQGTYISCFLMGMCPMNFNYHIAWIVPVLMIGMFASSSFLLGRHILVRWLGCEKAGASFAMALLLFGFYQVMEAPFEGIYWYNGSTHYVLMQSVWFFLLALASGSLWAEKKRRAYVCCGAAAVLSVIVGGGNLVTGLQAEILMAFLVCYAFFQKRYSAVKSIVLSFYNTAVFAIRWTPVFMVLLWFLLLPLLWKWMKASDREFSHPALVTAGAYCVISAMFTPTLYAVGMTGLSRVDNIIQMTYYLAVLFVTAYWLGYFSHRARRGDSAAEAFGLFLERAGSRMTAVCLLLLMAVWVLTADKNTYTSISALRSVAYGEAQTFYREALARYEIYTDESIADAVVTPYSERPALFDFTDLSEDEGNWMNLAVARYYHKDSVKNVKRDTQ